MANEIDQRGWLKSLTVANYRCVRGATLTLTPLHALIGPNDSGKSTLLAAIKSLSESVRQRGPRGMPEGSMLLGQTSNGKTVRFDVPSKGSIVAEPLPMLEEAFLFRPDPDFLRRPSALLSAAQPIRFQDERGLGLPAIIDTIRDRNLTGPLVELNEELRRLFPTVDLLQLRAVSGSQKAIGVKLRNGVEVPAEQMSEGLLYYLAFWALSRIDPPIPIVLVEEPENGLHPARIKDVMAVLKEASKTTQIVLATHSPFVINELEGHQVSVVTRTPEEGTKVTLLSDTPHFAERSKVYALGELWVSYADGKLEEPLLSSHE